ncbi:MAG: SH3 domain-containing protein, partial [Limisphaerales bacterium]
KKKKATKSTKSTKTTKAKESTAAANLVYNPPATATVKQEAVNVRGRASFVGEVITHLHKGETVTVLEEINISKPKKDEPAKWAKISMPTNTPVWVSGDYVDAATMTAKSRLNVRGGPGENYSVVARVEKGTPIKEIRKNKGWIEIETPTNAFGFVAADFLNIQPATAPAIAATTPEPAPAPAPAPEATTVKPETAPVAANPNEAPATATTPAEPAPTAPPVAPAPEVSNEPPPKRVVTREGTVKKARNIQSPTDYELHDARTGEAIEYLMSATADKTLKPYLGMRVLVTGPEVLDARWKSTPIVEVENIELP